MASGLYGQTIPATVTADDIDIYYTYSETRSADASGQAVFHKLSSNILVQQSFEDGSGTTILEGMYKLNLPVNEFGQKGFYTVYIKPHEIPATIADVSVLSDFPAVRGIVVQEAGIGDSKYSNLFLSNNGLVGYRVIYIDPVTKTRSDISRIVTSNNRCEPLQKQATNSNAQNTVYRYNNSSNTTFITLTPALSNAGAPNVTPYIGSVGQNVLFVNTKFSPIALDIEVVDHDDETISIMLEGSQSLNNDTGRITTFNDKGEIYHQAQSYTIKDDYTGEPIKTVKEHKINDIDFNETLE